MVKEKPLKAATKKKQPSKPVKKQVSAKKKNKKKELKEMPVWCRYLLGCLIVVAFTSVFYFFFIRPYAYRWKPCYGLKGYGVCMPADYKVHGIDISHYQGKINWEMLKQTRQGQFPIQFIFMKATEGGDYSDKKFVANFDSAKVDMKKLQADLKHWLRRVEAHYGVKPIIYASYKFKTKYLNDSVFNSYPYWIAHYYVDSVKYQGEWKFWQHTDVGTLPGIKEQVDLNIFNGGKEGLDALRIKNKEGAF